MYFCDTSNIREHYAKDPCVVRLGDKYFMYYSLWVGIDGKDKLDIGISVSDDLESWTPVGRLPIGGGCEENGIGAPGAIVLDGVIHMFYQTYGNNERDAICHATSRDGINFEKDPTNPVFAPTADWCCGRAIDADVIEFRGRLYLYFATRDHMMKIQKLGVASARQIAHITYLSRELLQEKFGRGLQQNFVEAPAADRAKREADFKTYFQIESYLDYQALKFVRRFDANSYLHITRSMDLFDAGERYGSLEAACARVKAKCLVVSYQNDILFTEWQSKEIVHALLKGGKSVSYCHLEAGTGHDSFLTDIEDLSGLVYGFLMERTPKVLAWQKKQYRNVTGMVREGAHVIDIGCGDGTLLNVLRKVKNATGDGVDIDIDPFKETVADGHDAFWEDADEGLSVIPDGHYDVAICSDTLQEVKNPRGLLHEALRIADEAIVTFPNFACYWIRLVLGFKGRLPVSKQLPFEWYDTPNIHCITLKDFRRLCAKEGIEILEVKAESRRLLGKLFLALGLKNLGAAKIIARIRRKTS